MPKAKPKLLVQSSNGTSRHRLTSGRVVGRAKPRALEDAVVGLAITGKLAEAGRSAIRAQRAAGLAVTYMDGNEIVTEYPDGRRVVLRTLTPLTFKIPKGVTRIRGR